MPAKDTFGSQPPLELMKLWIDYGFWYDRLKQTTKFIKGMQLMAAMGPPGGGRTHISKRLQSRFNLINMTFPSVSYRADITFMQRGGSIMCLVWKHANIYIRLTGQS